MSARGRNEGWLPLVLGGVLVEVKTELDLLGYMRMMVLAEVLVVRCPRAVAALWISAMKEVEG